MMTWQERFAAIKALAPASLKMREPGDWYVSQAIEIKDGAMLRGDYGNGTTPEDAVADHWRAITELGPGEYLVRRATSTTGRKAFRWNGFMWADVVE